MNTALENKSSYIEKYMNTAYEIDVDKNTILLKLKLLNIFIIVFICSPAYAFESSCLAK